MSILRHQVLAQYRSVYRAINRATSGDPHSTNTLHEQQRAEFRKNLLETDEEEIKKHIKFAADVEMVVTKHLAQFVEYEPNKYKSNFRAELEWMDDANRPTGVPDPGVSCHLPPEIKPRKRKRVPMK